MTKPTKTFIKILLCAVIITCSLLGAFYLISKMFFDTKAYWFERRIKPRDPAVLFFFTPHNAIVKLCWCFIQSLFLLPTVFAEKKNYIIHPLVKFINVVFVILFIAGNALLHTLYSPTGLGKVVVAILSITDTAMVLIPTIAFVFAVKDYEPFEKLVRILLSTFILVTVASLLSSVGSLIGLIIGVVYFISYKNGQDNTITLLIRGK